MLNFAVKIQVILHLVLNNAESFGFVIITLNLGGLKFSKHHTKPAEIFENFPAGTLVSNPLDLFGVFPTIFKFLGKANFLGWTFLCHFSIKFFGLRLK